MTNLMNLFSPKHDASGKTSFNLAKGFVSDNTMKMSAKASEKTEVFTKKLSALIEQNRNAVKSVEKFDSKPTSRKLDDRAEESVAEVVSLLQSAELIPDRVVNAQELTPEAIDSIARLEEILKNLLTALNGGELTEEASLKDGQETDLPNMLLQAMEKCHDVISIQSLLKSNTVLTAQDPGQIQSVLLQKYSVKLSLEKVPIPVTGNIEDAINIAKTQIQKVIAVWKEISLNMDVTSTPVEDIKGPDLHTEGLLTLAQMLKSQAKTDQSPVASDQENISAELLAQSTGNLNKEEGKKGGLDSGLLSQFKSIFASVGQEGTVKPSNVSFVQDTILPHQTEQMVLDQLVDKMRTVRKGGLQQIRMQLQPPNLGKVHMKLDLQGQSVTARFTVDNIGVKQTIESNFNQLRDTLAEQGFKVEKFDVNVGYGNEEASHGKDVQDQWAMRKGWSNGKMEDQNELTVPTLNTDDISLAYSLDTGRRYGTNTIELFG